MEVDRACTHPFKQSACGRLGPLVAHCGGGAFGCSEAVGLERSTSSHSRHTAYFLHLISPKVSLPAQFPQGVSCNKSRTLCWIVIDEKGKIVPFNGVKVYSGVLKDL